jgi:protein TonB
MTMDSIAAKKDLIDEFQLVTAPQTDRLPAMLFLAALAHGILIIGVTFNVALQNEYADAISLEVTIVANPDQNIDRPEDSEYLAQASQQGGGNTIEQLRPSAPLQSAAAIDNVGQQDGDNLADTRVQERFTDQVLATRAQQAAKVAEDSRQQTADEISRAVALESGREQTLPLPQDDGATLKIHDDEPRQLVISADTRETVIASYLDTWKRRIEAVGDDYFPRLGRLEGLSGSPTLEVSIDASGQLSEVIIRKSSGSLILDQAALEILRRAAPFDPFPAEIEADYDRLRFAYKWLFSEQKISVSSSAQVAEP